MINNVMSCLQRGRNSLIVPKKRTIEELQNSRNMVLMICHNIQYYLICNQVFVCAEITSAAIA
jgi:hypothetical protein